MITIFYHMAKEKGYWMWFWFPNELDKKKYSATGSFGTVITVVGIALG